VVLRVGGCFSRSQTLFGNACSAKLCSRGRGTSQRARNRCFGGWCVPKQELGTRSVRANRQFRFWCTASKWRAHLFVGAAAADVALQAALDPGGRRLWVGSSTAFMATTKPGVQKPHCWASKRTNAAGNGIQVLALHQRLGVRIGFADRFQGQHAAGVDRLVVTRTVAGAGRCRGRRRACSRSRPCSCAGRPRG